jgi:hypothetical protein
MPKETYRVCQKRPDCTKYMRVPIVCARINVAFLPKREYQKESVKRDLSLPTETYAVCRQRPVEYAERDLWSIPTETYMVCRKRHIEHDKRDRKHVQTYRVFQQRPIDLYESMSKETLPKETYI